MGCAKVYSKTRIQHLHLSILCWFESKLIRSDIIVTAKFHFFLFWFTVTLLIYNSLSLSLQAQNLPILQILPPVVSLLPPGLPSRTRPIAQTVSLELLGFCFSFYLFFRFFWCRALRLVGPPVSFSVHVNIPYRIVFLRNCSNGTVLFWGASSRIQVATIVFGWLGNEMEFETALESTVGLFNKGDFKVVTFFASLTRQQSVTQHIQTETRNASLYATTAEITRRRCDVSMILSSLFKTYLLS